MQGEGKLAGGNSTRGILPPRISDGAPIPHSRNARGGLEAARPVRPGGSGPFNAPPPKPNRP